MKPIKIFYTALLSLLTVLWLLADGATPLPANYFQFRNLFLQYSGVIAIGLMSVAMLLAQRPKWLERRLHGLDKMYRLHKWLGITALAVSILHWWLAQGTKWMTQWGWLTRPPRGQRGGRGPAVETGLIEGWLRSHRALAETVGEWAFYAAVILLVLALIKRFPYHLFRKTHHWLAAIYLFLAWHALVLAKFDYWSRPLGWLLGALLLGGSVAALLTLAGRIGSGRKVQGKIESLTYYPELKVLESHIALQEGWPGHAAGQFAFVTTDASEGPHPYTIASAWNPAERRITFITKALGDHTGRLRDRLKTGMPVTVEGPYGCFDFRDAKPRQIWIGAGIGITPFVARMKRLAVNGDGKSIDLFHTTAVFEQAAIDNLTADAAAAGVRLHILVDAKDGLLDGARIRAAIPDWEAASIWFCGPPAFGQALRRDFLAHGLDGKHFHQELFHMR